MYSTYIHTVVPSILSILDDDGKLWEITMEAFGLSCGNLRDGQSETAL